MMKDREKDEIDHFNGTSKCNPRAFRVRSFFMTNLEFRPLEIRNFLDKDRKFVTTSSLF